MQGHGGLPSEGRFNESFGDIGVEIAGMASDLIDSFSDKPEALGAYPQTMPKSDYQALGYWLSLESLVPLVDVPYELDGGARKRAYDALLAFHVALPYNEAERQWLSEMSSLKNVGDYAIGELPRLIEKYEDHIMVAGVRRVVSGRDLMRRWISWRRETDEFEGQGSLGQAREALQELKDQLS